MPRVAIGAIFKNEAPYILEWVAYHQLVGVSDFFIADNDSTDGTSELLDRLTTAGIVVRLPFPTRDVAPQIPAYREILARFGDGCDWIAFIDGDEFIVPTGAERSVPRFLSGIARDDVGCVALNWAVYGSSGLLKRDPRPVLERFAARADRDSRINHTIKSIVRPAAVAEFANPHEVLLADGHSAVDSEGRSLRFGTRAAHTERVCWTGFRVNHYVIKSFAEWELKRKRGRAVGIGARRKPSFFADKDYADTQEAFDPELLAATKRRMAELAAAIA